MRKYDVEDLLIDEERAYRQNPMELPYPSFENLVKTFVKNMPNSPRNYLIEMGTLLGFSLFFYIILLNLKPIWGKYGGGFTLLMLFLSGLVVFFSLNRYVLHYLFKFQIPEMNDAIRLIFQILENNHMEMTDELMNNLLDKVKNKREFHQLIQSAIIASGVFSVVVSVFTYFTNLRDPNVDFNIGLYIEVLALGIFTIGSALAIILSWITLLSSLRKRILFTEALEAIDINRDLLSKE